MQLTGQTGLAEQLIGEVKKLQQEVGMYRAKLRTATEIIEKMPSEGAIKSTQSHMGP